MNNVITALILLEWAAVIVGHILLRAFPIVAVILGFVLTARYLTDRRLERVIDATMNDEVKPGVRGVV